LEYMSTEIRDMKLSGRVAILVVALLTAVCACALMSPADATADGGMPLPPPTSGIAPSSPALDPGTPVETAAPPLADAATAGAGAVQTGASNTIVVVRVGSPGNDGPITQVNTSGAVAASDIEGAGGDIAAQDPASGATSPASGTTASSQPDAATAGAAVAAASQQSASNLVVSIRVQSPGDNGSITQANIVGSAAASGTTSAPLDPVSSTAATPAAARTEASSDQYQAPAAQYQTPATASASTGVPAPTSWTWIWVWNCAPVSLSGQAVLPAGTISGATWVWTWNQNCDGIGPAVDPG
jgi:hypothetical protein